MRRANPLLKLSLASVLLAVCTLPALAQTTPIGPNETQLPTEAQNDLPGSLLPSSDPLAVLTRSTEVQKALGLTPEQITELEKIAQDTYGNQARTRSATPPDIASGVSQTRDAVAAVLTPEQLTQFRGILAGITGTQPEEAPSVRSRGVPPQAPPNLTEEQQEKLAQINEQAQRGIRSSIVRTRSSDPEAACQEIKANRARGDQARQAAQQQINQVLTAEQREVFKDQQGRSVASSLSEPPCAPPSR